MAVAEASDFLVAVIRAVDIRAATQAAGILAEAIRAVELAIRVAGIQVADTRAALRADLVIPRQEVLPMTILGHRRRVAGAPGR